MKSNAIVRIVLFSITILVLLGILTVGIFYDSFSYDLMVRQDKVIADQSTDPVLGPVAIDENISMGAVSSENIRDLEIEWASGSITIQPGEETDTIRFWDDYSGDDKYYMYYTTSGSKLKIQFCEALDWDSIFGITLSHPVNKDLTILVPADWDCDSLEIDAATAKLKVRDMTIRDVEIDTASGACGFESCNVGSLDIDTASGDVTFSGSLRELDCDGASAAIVADLSNIPDRIEVDTASGNLDITLPENAGFTAKIDGMSSDFSTEFETVTKNGTYICGDGACKISVSAMSGDLNIRKNSNLTSADVVIPGDEVHHAHTDACTNDPASCPDYTGHQHTAACTNNPSSCPNYDGGSHHTEHNSGHHGN